MVKSGDIPSWAMSAVAAVLEGLRMVDSVTYEHCLRVGNYSAQLAKAAGFDEYQQKVAEISGMLHDVGKLAVDQAIIHKPARLSEPEMKQMMTHSAASAQVVAAFGDNEFFTQVQPAVLHHHERIDGLGYPHKLAGEKIPILARLILIVDTLDAMGQDRSYRKGLPIEVIYTELQRCAGSQFDKNLVNIFLESHQYWSVPLDLTEPIARKLRRIA
jgi:HD-GYP domain-containing protein (c-di-GMP phosphodiesterase class II)